MDSQGLQVPGHTAHRLLRTSTGESIGFAFLLNNQVVDDLDSFGGLQLQRLNSTSVVTEVEGGEGKTGPSFPAWRVEGGNSPQHNSSSHLLQDISSSSSVQVLSTEQNNKYADSHPKVLIEATLRSSTDTNSVKNTSLNAGVEAMVKTMANEMLNIFNKSQKPPKSRAHIPSRGKELPDNVFKEYYVELPEIGCNNLNSDGTARQLKQKKHVKCKLCSSRITKNSFSQHMRNIHLPGETCGSCGKEFPASKILGHRRQCGNMKGEDLGPKIIANSRTNSPELVVVKARSADEMVSNSSTHLSTVVGDLEDGPRGSEAGPVGSEPETYNSEDMVGPSGELKVNSCIAETVELTEAGSGAGPGRSVAALRSLENSVVSSAAAAEDLEAAVGSSAAVAGSLSIFTESSEIAAGINVTSEKKVGSVAGIKSVRTKIQNKDMVEITIRVGSKAYILMVPKRKPFKKAIKKLAARLGKEVGRLSFTVEGGRRLQGQELMGDLEGRTIVAIQKD